MKATISARVRTLRTPGNPFEHVTVRFDVPDNATGPETLTIAYNVLEQHVREVLGLGYPIDLTALSCTIGFDS